MADCASAEKDARPRFDPPPRVKGPPKYSTSYTRETLEAAVQDVLRGEALREVIAKFQRDYEHDIPLMTLRDAVSRAKKQGSSGFVKKGRPTSLTWEQEIEGLKHMNKMADHGLTPDKSYVIWFFSNIAAILGIPFPKKPEGKWWRCFKKRHSEWVLKSTQNYERCRACAMGPFPPLSLWRIFAAAAAGRGTPPPPLGHFGMEARFLRRLAVSDVAYDLAYIVL